MGSWGSADKADSQSADMQGSQGCKDQKAEIPENQRKVRIALRKRQKVRFALKVRTLFSHFENGQKCELFALKCAYGHPDQATRKQPV